MGINTPTIPPRSGNFRVVDCCADYKVRRVSGVADIEIKLVNYPPGLNQWREVRGAEDFTIQWVGVGEDFTVKFK